MTAVAAAQSPQPLVQGVRALRVAGSVLVTSVLLGVAAAIVTCVIVGATPLVVVSGSMAPAINAGDLIVVRSTPIEDVEVGQVVSFHDPARDGDLVTHRVVSLAESGSGAASGRVEVVTRGDANTAVEEWGMPTGSTVGRYVLRVPRLGFVAGAAAQPAVLLFAFLAAVAVFALRLIWKS